MGYDGRPMIGFDLENVAAPVRAPSDHAIATMRAFRKGTKPAWPKAGFIPLAEVVMTDRCPA